MEPLNRYLQILYPLIFLIGCKSEYGSVDQVKIIYGLKNNQSIVAYVGLQGATADDAINVSFFDTLEGPKFIRGDIFFAYHGHGIDIEKISLDTIKIKNYSFYGSNFDYHTNLRGITFIYDPPLPEPKK